MPKRLFDVIEGLRLLHTHTSEDGKKVAKVYRDAEWGEYRVKHFTDGVHHKDGDAHTDDIDDAHGTAKAWLGEEAVAPADTDERSGYPAPRDPKMLPEKPGAAARFVAKHMGHRGGPRITDIDKSTLDDALFNATNMKRAVPKGNDTHGHTPTGEDAKVYESHAEIRNDINRALDARLAQMQLGKEKTVIKQMPGAVVGSFTKKTGEEKEVKEGIIAEALARKKPVKEDAGGDKEALIEKAHDRTLMRHGEAIKRSKAEVYHEGWNQDFGPDKSCIESKTSMGVCKTEHDHKTGAIKHSWSEK